MNTPPNIEELRDRHDMLYGKVIQDGGAHLLRDEVDLQAFLRDVRDLLQEINTCASRVRTLDEYRWLANATLRWQVAFSSILNLPETIPIAPPPGELLEPLPPNKALSEEELDYWRRTRADYFGCLRVAQDGRQGSAVEMEWDWHQAQVALVSDILDGQINFAGRIASQSYWRLEDVWVKELKCFRAYFLWLNRGAGVDQALAERDYYDVCEHIRRMLVAPGIKARHPTEFDEARAYIEKHYLTEGKIDETKAGTKIMISNKAERIWRTTGEFNREQNWHNAKVYVKMFYENIIPAVTNSSEESILSVLKAFQYSKAPENGWWVINCFETALATYFLKPEIVEELWKDSEQEPIPDSSVESVAEAPSWPPGFEIPEVCVGQFRCDGDRIVFRGVMKESQRDALRAKLSRDEDRKKLDDLFKQSRLIRRERTL